MLIVLVVVDCSIDDAARLGREVDGLKAEADNLNKLLEKYMTPLPPLFDTPGRQISAGEGPLGLFVTSNNPDVLIYVRSRLLSLVHVTPVPSPLCTSASEGGASCCLH